MNMTIYNQVKRKIVWRAANFAYLKLSVRHYYFNTNKNMGKVLLPREAGEFIVKHAKYLKVCQAGIDKLTNAIIDGIKTKAIDAANFSQHDFHPKHDDDDAVDFIFLIDTLNFCFWTPTNHTKYKVNGYTGYFALCAAIRRAIADGVDITNPRFYATIDAEKLQHIMRSDDGETKVPLLQERVDCLHEVGKRLLEKWDGKFENVIKSAENSAARLLQLIVSEFPCFRDEADYAGERVALYKRAQILIGDLWACFRGKGFGHFNDLHCITMFADYRIPQVLVHFGALEYSPELMEILKRDEVMKNGDPMEVEIRGASIYIVEVVKDAVLKELKNNYPDVCTDNANSIAIDNYLWDYRRKYAKELEYIPFHKTMSVYY